MSRISPGWATARLVMLCVAVLAMRALVPQGYMPDWQSGSLFAVMPCPSQGTMPTSAEPQQASAHHGHGDDSDAVEHAEHRAADPCSFAGLASPALSPPDLADIVAVARLDADYADEIRAVTLLRRLRQRPPARAPPVLA